MDVGVPLSKVFIINPDGEIHHYESQMYQKTYKMLAEMADQMFPPLFERK